MQPWFIPYIFQSGKPYCVAFGVSLAVLASSGNNVSCNGGKSGSTEDCNKVREDIVRLKLIYTWGSMSFFRYFIIIIIISLLIASRQ